MSDDKPLLLVGPELSTNVASTSSWMGFKIQVGNIARLPSWGTNRPEKCVESDQSKVEAIKELPRLADKAAVQRFLGMCHDLRKFCSNLLETVLPIRNLTKYKT